MAGINHNLVISATSIPNTGTDTVVGTVTFTGVTLVNVTAGQSLTAASFTLNVDAAPSTYPTPGNLSVFATDAVGNGIGVTVSYTGTSGSTFTGCSVTNAPDCTSVAGPANPLLTGTVTINTTDVGNHPWLNTLTSSSSLTVSIQNSEDGGTTWQPATTTVIPGGIFLNRFGQTITSRTLTVGPLAPAANGVRMVCNATGPSAIEISGSGTVTSR